MNNRYVILYRITCYITRVTIFGVLNILLSCLADIGCQGSEEILSQFIQEQRDCKTVTAGAWKLFCTASIFVLVSR